MTACPHTEQKSQQYLIYFHCLQYHNDLSTAVQLTNRLLRFWANRGFVYKRVSSPSFLVSSQSLIVITTSWFAMRWMRSRGSDIYKELGGFKKKGGLQAVYYITHTNFFSKTLYFVHNMNGSVTFSSRRQEPRGIQLLDKDFPV